MKVGKANNMKKYIFVVALCSGLTFTQVGEGYNENEALMDACMALADSDYPQDEIMDISLEGVV